VFAALRADGTLFRAQASISAVDSDEGRLFTIVLQLVPARAAAPG
jgi:hypothetical protein